MKRIKVISLKNLVNCRLLILIFFLSCSHSVQKKEVKYIPKPSDSKAVLDLAHASYTKGCVQAHHKFGVKKVFYECGKKATHYINEIRSIIEQ